MSNSPSNREKAKWLATHLSWPPPSLNKAVKRKYFKLPTAVINFAYMHDAKYFSKFDASNYFWQIHVDKDS